MFHILAARYTEISKRSNRELPKIPPKLHSLLPKIHPHSGRRFRLGIFGRRRLGRFPGGLKSLENRSDIFPDIRDGGLSSPMLAAPIQHLPDQVLLQAKALREAEFDRGGGQFSPF